MAYKFVVFAACVAVASAGVIPAAPVAYAAPAAYAHPAPVAYAQPAAYAHAAPVAYAQPAAYAHPVAKAIAAPVLAKAAVAVDTDYDPNPAYNYAYDIHDSLTGDAKSQQESRQGDVVQGSYSLVEPDGTRRTVEYTADPVNGFNAVVHKDAPAVAVKAVAAAPVVAKVAAPVAYAAPAAYAAAPAYYHH
ncbi:larval cuticle protein A3A-like isoform X2 [Frankliniella occidentalis]|uniref:Larval cuticle protein A3A-like isoform X2 n=1 Tax=Frankliniella occidentalis TaxID=133901 RepID=A0A9C6WVH5_FRAOC|nr:larval cuticle protein A3A-like isoform X2 [Frankliniella occidentalis]